MIGVGLRTDQRAIQLQVNLFDDGMGQIVDGPQFFSGHQVSIGALFQTQFHGKVTAPQIHKIVQPRYNEFHGIDARGGGLKGHHAIGIDTNVGRRHLEKTQRWVEGPLGTLVSGGSVCHGLTSSSSSSGGTPSS